MAALLNIFNEVRSPIATLLAGALLSMPASAQPSITGNRVNCTSGEAAGHACHNVALLSRLMPDRLEAPEVLDMWGWTDSVNGHEYALVGTVNAVAFVDITDPINPEYLGKLPSQDNSTSGWRDLKVFQDHVFVVQDVDGTNGMQVFDLTQLRSPASTPQTFVATAHYDLFDQAHNVAINTATGFAYVVGSDNGPCPLALHMVDITDPLQPAYAGCYRDTSLGDNTSGYTHDVQCVVYHGPDTDHDGSEICILANVDGISVADVSDKSQPRKLSSAEYPDASYAHQAWLSEDHTFLYLNDETDELMRHWLGETPLPGTRTLIWDMTDLDDPVLAAEYFGPTDATDHNLYIKGDTLYMANYASGLRMADISSPTAPVEIAYFDTYPFSDHAGYFGAWTAYPYFASGTVAVTSAFHGLYLLKYDPVGTTAKDPSPKAPAQLATFALGAAYPNPFNQRTTLELSNPVAQSVTIKVHDVAGRTAAVLFSGFLPSGRHLVHLDATRLPSGHYLVIATAGGGRYQAVRTAMRTR